MSSRYFTLQLRVARYFCFASAEHIDSLHGNIAASHLPGEAAEAVFFTIYVLDVLIRIIVLRTEWYYDPMEGVAGLTLQHIRRVCTGGRVGSVVFSQCLPKARQLFGALLPQHGPS